MQKVLYDEFRGLEYSPIMVMNNSDYAKVCQDPNAKACIFVINATQQLNSDIAIGFRKNLNEGKIDFLVNYNTVKSSSLILKNNDILSIRKYGKYIIKNIIGTTKKNNLVLEIEKYI